MQRLKGSRILVVDDTPSYLEICRDALEKDYDVMLAKSGSEALEIMERYRVDLILLDVHMPEMDGFEICRLIKMNNYYKMIPVIFFTSSNNPEDIASGFSEGAVDYVIKPFHTIEIRERVRIHLELKITRDDLLQQKIQLEEEIVKKMDEVERTRDSVIRIFSNIIETRDPMRGSYVNKAQSYARTIARELSRHKRYGRVLTTEFIHLIYRATPLHDIGKIGVPDRILLKPGSLTKEEFEVVIHHTTLGYEALKSARNDVGGNSELFTVAMDIALYHHERWDGKGYPYGLKAEDIPIAARIVALADAFNAQTIDKPYRETQTIEALFEKIASERGAKYDPDVVDAFFAVKHLILEDMHKRS